MINNKTIALYIIIVINLNLVAISQTVTDTVTFETGTTVDTTIFSSNGKTFDLGDGWVTQNFTGYGSGVSDWYIDHTPTCEPTTSGIVGSIKTNDGSDIYFYQGRFYISYNCFTALTEGQIKIYWYKDGLEVTSKIYTLKSGINNRSNGYYLVDFTADGQACIAADEFKFETVGAVNYIGFDDFVWSTSPSVSSISNINGKEYICSIDDSSTLTANEVVVGSGATLTWYDQSNGLGNNLGSNSSINVSTDSIATYYARLDGFCNTVQKSFTVTRVNIDTSIVADGNILTATAGENTNFQWLDCSDLNSPKQNEIDQVFTANENGSYAVEITQNTCIDTSNCIDITILGTSTNNTLTTIDAYPNPVNDNLIVEIPINETATITINNNLGDIIRSIETSKSIQISMNDLPKGIYLITVKFADRYENIKVLKN